MPPTRTPDADALVSFRAPSVAQMFFDRVRDTPDHEAYRYLADGTWVSTTWWQVGEQVRNVAAGLIALGVTAEQRVAIASGTRYEWIVADLAAMCAGAATTTVYPTATAGDVAFILADSDSRVVFAENQEQVAKLRERRDELPSVHTVITFDPVPPDPVSVESLSVESLSVESVSFGSVPFGSVPAGSVPAGSGETAEDLAVRPLGAVAELGRAYLAAHPHEVEQRIVAILPDNLATLIYTSGTTGRPKGVRLSHSSWTYEGAAVAALNLLDIADLQYLWLPLAHAFGKVLLTTQLQVGFPAAVDGDLDRMNANLAAVRPTFMGAAPRIFEKAYGRIVHRAHSGGGLRARTFDAATRVGLAVSGHRRRGTPVPWHLALAYRVADRLIFAKVRAGFGGRLRFFISGSAALPEEVAEWFHAAGILVLEGYGLTETAGGTLVNRPDHFRFGTVGLPLPGTEVAIAGDGEIMLRGPGVMAGYHRLPQESREVLGAEGWLATGDIGEIDFDGFLRVTDRKKDLFKTSGGKYVAPSHIEGRFVALCPLAAQMVVHGEGRNYCVALVALDEAAVHDWAARHGLGGQSFAQLAASEQLHSAVDACVRELNARLNRWETIKNFAVLDHGLTIESGELTASMKVRRQVVEARYRPLLDSLYQH